MCLTLGGTKYLSQTILEILLSLLKKEVPEHGRHLQQYFHVFLSYAMKGAREVSITVEPGHLWTMLKCPY